MRYPAAGTASYDGFSCQLLFVEGRICKKYTSSRRIKRGSLPLHLKNRTVTAESIAFINTGRREGAAAGEDNAVSGADGAPVPPADFPQDEKEDLPF